MKSLALLCLPLVVAACATNPEYAVQCRNATGCGSAVVNPNFGPIQSQAVAPETGRSFPF
jgi:hypothetical protein